MKKTLLSITAVLVALTVFFAACDSPVTNPSSIKTTSAEEIASVSGPEWVKATAFRGGIFVSWAFNKDAKTYSVYRQRSDGLDALVRLQTPTSTDNQTVTGTASESVLDVVSPTNQLADGVEYTYYVTTNSGEGLTGRAVGGGTSATINDATTVILDGASKTTVTAIIPARYSTDATPVWQNVSVLLEAGQTLDAAAVTAEKVTTTTPTPAEKLLLSWPHYNSGFKYTVAYDIGKTLTLNTNISSPDLDPNTASGTYAFYSVPLFGGENTARIIVKLGTDEYYYKPLTITKPLDSYARDIITGLSSVSVTRDKTTAKISWTAVTGAPNPADYKLYRIASPDATASFTAGTAVTVTGDWVPVPIIPVSPSTTTSTSQNATTITVQDTGLTLNTGYIYALYAEVGSAKSTPVFGSATAVSLTSTATPLNIQSYTVAGSDPDVLTHKVTLGWTKQDGVASYTLLRAPVTNYPESTTGDFVAVGGTLAPDASGRYTVTDAPDIRKSYKYRLVAHDAAGSTVAAETDYPDPSATPTPSTTPFLDYVESALTVTATGIGTAYAAEVQIGAPSVYLTDLYADIYRATVPAGVSVSPGAYANIAVSDAAFTKIVDNQALKGGALTYLDTGLTIGTNYIYRHRIKHGTSATTATEIPNIATTTISSDTYKVVDLTGYVQTASVPDPSGSSVSLAGTTPADANTTTYYFTFSGGAQTNLSGASVQVQARFTTAASTANWGAYSSIASGSILLTSTAITTPAISANTNYFTITRPTAALPATNDYRLVLADQDGNVASYDPSTATVLVNDAALGW